MVNYHGKSSWFITMDLCHDLVPRTFAAQIWEIFTKIFFLLKKIVFELKFRFFFYNFDFWLKFLLQYIVAKTFDFWPKVQFFNKTTAASYFCDEK